MTYAPPCLPTAVEGRCAGRKRSVSCLPAYPFPASPVRRGGYSPVSPPCGNTTRSSAYSACQPASCGLPPGVMAIVPGCHGHRWIQRGYPFRGRKRKPPSPPLPSFPRRRESHTPSRHSRAQPRHSRVGGNPTTHHVTPAHTPRHSRVGGNPTAPPRMGLQTRRLTPSPKR